MYPIYIPTKNRPYKQHTAEELIHYKVPFTMVLEKEQVDDHRYYLDNAGDYPLLVLQDNNRGCGFFRNAILNDARAKGYDWCWLIDDDITSCVEVVDPATNDGSVMGDRSIPQLMAAVETALVSVNSYDPPEDKIFSLGAQYIMEARKYHKPYIKWNRPGFCITLLNTNPAIPFRENFKVQDDVAFVLDNLIAVEGWTCGRLSNWHYRTPLMGESSGGSEPYYDKEDLPYKEANQIYREYIDFGRSERNKAGHGNWKTNWKAVDRWKRGDRDKFAPYYGPK